MAAVSSDVLMNAWLCVWCVCVGCVGGVWVVCRVWGMVCGSVGCVKCVWCVGCVVWLELYYMSPLRSQVDSERFVQSLGDCVAVNCTSSAPR